MSKWKITSYSSSHRATGSTEIEAANIDEVRKAADQVESETGAKTTTIAKKSSAWGYITQARK